MRKKRLIWTIIMLAVMAASLVTMFLPWSRSLGGSDAVLPGNILRWVLAAVVTLVFAGSVFLYFTRRTAWGMLYALLQGVNLFAMRAVTRGANTEAGTQLYGMTAWYAVCVFFTAAILLVWVLGFFMGAWKRPSVKHQIDPHPADAPRAGWKFPVGKKASRGKKAPDRRKADREEPDEEYDEALAIAEEAERMRAKAEAARKAADSAGAPEQSAWGTAGSGASSSQEGPGFFLGDIAAPEDTPAPRKKASVRASQDGLSGAKDRITAPAAPENEAPEVQAVLNMLAPDADRTLSDQTGAEEAGAAERTNQAPAADRSLSEQTEEEAAGSAEENVITPAAGRAVSDQTDAEASEAAEENVLTPDAEESQPGQDASKASEPEEGPASRNMPAPDADRDLSDEEADEEEEEDYLDASYAPVDGKSEDADTGKSPGVKAKTVYPEDEEPDEEPGDEEEDTGEDGDKNEDFMDALGGFLGRLFAATKKGAAKAAGGIRAKATEARARRKSEDELAAEDELAEEDALDEEDAAAEDSGEASILTDRSPDAVARAIMPDADENASLDRAEKKSSGERDDEDGKKEGFRIFGKVRRDDVEEEPEFLRKRKKKSKAKPDEDGRRPGFIPSTGLLVKAGIGLVVILLAVLAVFLLVRRFRLESIDMEDYVVISSSGYEGYGVAEIKVDSEALEAAVADALVSKGQIKAGTGSAVEAFRAFESYNIIMEQLGYTVDKDDHLSNGDVVTVSFVCDNTVLKEFGLKAGPESITHTVRGLRVVKEYSPFDSDLIVEFTGTEPYGRIVLTWAGDYPLHFTKSKSDGLSNGDVVVVTALPNDGYDAESLAVEYGIILTETTKEYPVTGLSNYISNVSSLSGTVLSGLDEEAQAIIQDKAAGDYAGNETLAASERVGSMILTGSEETEARNYLYMVYKLTYQRGKTTFDYYYYVRFRNVILHTDGSYEKDETCEVPTGRHGLFGLLDNNDALRIDWLHAVVGFKTVEDLYIKKIEDKIGTFTISTDLGLEGIPADALTPAGGTSGNSEPSEQTISPDPVDPAEGGAGTGDDAASPETAGDNANSEDVPL